MPGRGGTRYAVPMTHATKLLDTLDARQLRDRLRQVEEERSALITLIRAAMARERARRPRAMRGREVVSHASR
jgi:hypothetical protein